MSDRGTQIEGFFWLLMRLAGTAFGWLMVVAGVVFALAFLAEQTRSGVITINGRSVVEAAQRWQLIAQPLLVAVAGYLLVALCRAKRS